MKNNQSVSRNDYLSVILIGRTWGIASLFGIALLTSGDASVVDGSMWQILVWRVLAPVMFLPGIVTLRYIRVDVPPIAVLIFSGILGITFISLPVLVIRIVKSRGK